MRPQDGKGPQQNPEMKSFNGDVLELEVERNPAKKYATAYDLRDMDALGIVPSFKRRFDFFAMLGFSSTVIVAWEVTLVTLSFGLFNGGTGGLFCKLSASLVLFMANTG